MKRRFHFSQFDIKFERNYDDKMTFILSFSPVTNGNVSFIILDQKLANFFVTMISSLATNPGIYT